MRYVALLSLGCAKNLVDSEMMLSMFEDGFQLTLDPSKADLIIVNTCGFIASAKEESIREIFRMRQYKKAKLVVVGCLTERYYEQLVREMGEVDLFVPISDYPHLHQRIKELFPEDNQIVEMNPLRRVLSGPSFSAYLRISEGCDHFCAFCAIPYIRGRYKSRDMEEVLEEARILQSKGIREISLISQDPAAYGKDFNGHKPDFCDLLERLDVMGFDSIRLLYLYPSELSDRFVELVRDSKTIAHYFDIPVQSGSDKVLHSMNRPDTVENNLRLIAKLREAMPLAAFRTTLIAGFPGEGERDVASTLDFLEKARFDHVGVFSYSREEGTLGYKMRQIPQRKKEERRIAYLQKAKEVSLKNNLARIGETMEGFVIGHGKKEGEYLLRSYWNAPDEIDGNITFASKRPLKVGDKAKLKITAAFYHDLFGEAL